MYHSVALRIFPPSQSHRHSPSRMLSSQTEPHTHQTITHHFSHLPAPVTTLLLSVSVNETILGTSSQWNHTVSSLGLGLFRLAKGLQRPPYGSYCATECRFSLLTLDSGKGFSRLKCTVWGEAKKLDQRTDSPSE